MREILRIHININKIHELKAGDKTLRMVLFDGYCDSDLFKGNIMDGGCDMQLIGDHTQMSARYMLEGTDCEGKPCKLFIENNNAGDGEAAETKPVIYTDSDALKWLETAELSGRIIQGEKLMIKIYSA